MARKKVFVGMSGGVDSSVAAALLKREGFHVVGLYMKCWTEGKQCTSLEDERMARVAASHLGIPFYVLNLIEEYKRRVVDYLLEGYRKGITPNPDVMCNKEIKFGLFFDKARELGADYIATGHYARLRPAFAKATADKQGSCGQARIFQAKDKEKDQSYFLSFIKPEVLSYVLFPIGEYTKPQVRELARQFGLPNAERKDSQGICFVGKVSIIDFLKQYLPVREGAIQDTAGNVLGRHEGVHFYTIGQRKGIGLAGGPWYVARKDKERNILVVSKNEEDIRQQELVFEETNFFSPDISGQVQAAIRYRQHPVPATLEKGTQGWRLLFHDSQRAVTPGQIAALYRGEELLGGGVIC